MVTTVAVGTDGSETAAQAVRMAAEIARRFEARVVLLGVYDPSLNTRRPTDPEGEWSNVEADRLRDVLAQFEEELGAIGVAVAARLEEGDPAEVLVRLAEECEADLLVVGSKGMRRRILGSIPNTVTHRAPCSVVVVKTT